MPRAMCQCEGGLARTTGQAAEARARAAGRQTPEDRPGRARGRRRSLAPWYGGSKSDQVPAYFKLCGETGRQWR
jgi:hypothetical protein